MIQVIVKPRTKIRSIPQMLIPPTQERARQGLGIREINHRFAAVDPFEHMFERNVFGYKGGQEAHDRLIAAKYFMFLYIINEEAPTKYAMLDWSKFMLGMGSLSSLMDIRHNHQDFITEKKQEYIKLCKDLAKGIHGPSHVITIRKLCTGEYTLEKIERQYRWCKGMAGVILRKTLDDINLIFTS